MPTLDTKIRVSTNILTSQVDDEMVLLNLDSGKYFSLDDVGTRMWLLINEHGQLRAVQEALLQEYQVDEQQLEHDLLDLTDKLVANGLLQIVEP